jgi:hypothetical protein
MPNILSRLQSAYQRNPAEVLNLLPEFFDSVGKTVIELPCKVGDTVYKLAAKLNSEDPIIIPIQVDDIAMFGWQCDKHDAYPFTFMLGNIGKTVFLTEQAAKDALERGKENDN